MEHGRNKKIHLENMNFPKAPPVVSGPPSAAIKDNAGERFSINIGANVASAVMSTALMLWYVPYLIGNLGAAAYGMIALATSLTMYASVVSNGLHVSINRFLAIDVYKEREAEAIQTFNTALAINLAICILLMVPATFVAFLYPVLFDVPAGMKLESQILFVSVVLAFFIAIFSSTFQVSSVIKHRFDLRNIVMLAVQLSRIGIVVACFTFWSASLWWVALGFITSAWIGLLGDVLVWRALTPQLKVSYHNIDRHRIRTLINFSGWVSVNQFGNVLLMQVSLLVVNAFFGAEMTGRFGSIMLFATLIMTITDTFASVLSPAFMARYALNDVEGLKRIAIVSVKLLGIGLALPVGLLCGLGRPLLSLWLGPEFADLDLILILLIGQLSINNAVRPLAYVLTAYDRVKLQAVFTILLGVGNLLLAVTIARWGAWGVAGVAAAGAAVWTLRNAIFLSAYSANVMGLRVWTFFGPLTSSGFATLAVASIGMLSTWYWRLENWFELGMVAFAVAAIYIIAALKFLMSQEDRNLLWSFLGKKVGR
jgi:membrane protein EpsK